MKTIHGTTMSELEWLEAARGTFVALCKEFARPRKEKVRAAKFLVDLHDSGVGIPARYVRYARGILG